MNETKKIRHFLQYVAVLSFFGIVGFVFGALQETPQRAHAEVNLAAASSFDATANFKNIELIANAAYVVDLATGETVFAKNEQAQLPLASITKVPVILLAHTYLTTSDVITFVPSDLQPEGDSGFEAGESWRIGDLIDFTLMTSSNDGATAIARAIELKTGEDIVSLLNAQAAALQLPQTYFVNETGLDSSLLSSGAYSSARDTASLLAFAYNTAPNLFAATTAEALTFTNLDGDTYEGTNTNKAISQLPGLVFGKTGFTDLAGGNLAVVTEVEPGHPFAVVVLGSTLDGRFDDVAELVHATLPKLTE